MSLRAVLLDLGHTLVYESPPREAIYGGAARARGLAVTDEEMRALMRRTHAELPEVIDGAYRYSDRWFEEFVRRIFHVALELPAPELDALTAELFARFEDPRTFRLYDGAEDLLDALADRGLRVGLVSNWSARLPRLLEALDLARRLDFVVCSALDRVEKPSPAIFRLALERAGVPAEEALHAGDREDRDGGARAVGIEVVIVDHLGRSRPGTPGVVGDLSALADLVLERAA